MPAPAISVPLSKKSQDGLIQFQYQAYQLMASQYNIREQLRQVDLAYLREQDYTEEQWRARIANAWGDSTKYQNITVPVVMPQVETTVAYQTAVFLTGIPLFGCVAPPKYIDQAVAMETVIDENATRGSWKRELMLMFRDGAKYNIAGAELVWDREVTAAYATDITFANGKQAKPTEVIWEGNCLNRMDMYNTIFDTRVPPTEVHKSGEFAGYSKLFGRIALKQLIARLGDSVIRENIKPAFESGFGGWGIGGLTSAGGVMGFYIPYLNPDALINKNMYATMDWMQWAGLVGSSTNAKIQYNNLYEVTKLYIRLLPSDFDIRVPGSNTPQIWKLIIVNHQVIIHAEKQTNAHDYLPIIFCQPNEDGLAYQTKSDATNVMPIQYVTSALMNSAIAARRRAITDRVLYDPSRISEAAINSTNPSAKIPCRPAAYGKNLSEAVYQFPYRDDQAAIAMQEIGQLTALGDLISGHNKAQQGLFVKGNKTRHEYEDIMRHANGRDQMKSILLEDQFFTPMKLILKSNIMQYQQPVTYYSRDKKTDITIDPVEMRNALIEFKISDGLTPSDKLINADVASVAMQQIGTSPQLSAKYDIAGMFSYLAKTQGAQLDDFEKPAEQVAYEQALNAWAAQGDKALEMLKAMAPLALKDQPIDKLLEVIKTLIPPQPVPEQFGYNPAAQQNTSTSPAQSTTGA